MPSALLPIVLMSLSDASAADCPCVDLPVVALSGMRTSLSLSLPGLRTSGEPWPRETRALIHMGAATLFNESVRLYAGSNASKSDYWTLSPSVELNFTAPAAGWADLTIEIASASGSLWVGGRGGEYELWTMPAWLCLLPPLLTVILAVVSQQVLVALLAGVWLAETLMHGANPLLGALRTVDAALPDAIGGDSREPRPGPGKRGGREEEGGREGGRGVRCRPRRPPPLTSFCADPLIIVFTLLLGGTISVSDPQAAIPSPSHPIQSNPIPSP